MRVLITSTTSDSGTSAPAAERRLVSGKSVRYTLSHSGNYRLYVALSSSQSKVAQAMVTATVHLPGKKGKKSPEPVEAMHLSVPFRRRDGGSDSFHESHFEASVV